MKNSPEPRWNLIRHLRQQIAAGTYDTEENLEIVANKLVGWLRSGDRLIDDRKPREKVEGNSDQRL